MKSLRHDIRFRWLITGWLIHERRRQLFSIVENNLGSFRRALIVVLSLVVGLTAIHFGAGHVSKTTLASFLLTTAAMIGGTTAIVFSIVIFLLQGVSDLYSSKYFEAYTNSWRDLQAVYGGIIVITTCFFASALYLDSLASITQSAPIFVFASLTSIGAVFALIDLQFDLVRRKIRPAEIVAFLRTRGLAFVKETEKNANRIAEILSFPETGLSREEALAVAYTRLLGRSIVDLGYQIEILIDIAVRLSARQEQETTKSALSAAGQLLAMYLTARKTSSVARPAGALFITESDSREFLETHFGQLNQAGQTFLREGKSDLAVEIVYAYLAIADTAKDMVHLGSVSDNPVLEQTMWSLKSYAERGDPEPDEDVIFQGVRALAKIGVMSLQGGFDNILHGVELNLSKLGLSTFKPGKSAGVSASIGGYLEIIAATFKNDVHDRTFPVDRALEGISEIVVVLQGFIEASGPIADYGMTSACQMAYVEMPALLDSILRNFDSRPDDPTKEKFLSDLISLFESLRKHFRDLAKHVAADSLLAGAIDRLILNMDESIIALLPRADTAHVRTQLHDLLRWLVHSPYWFFGEGPEFDADSHSVRTAGEVVSKTGILSWHSLSDKVIVRECIQAIDAIASEALARGRDSSGHAEPRIYVMACFLGILAMKSGWTDVLDYLRGRIQTFDAMFFEKHLAHLANMPEDFDPRNHKIIGIPHHDQLRREIERWASEFVFNKNNSPRLGSAEDLMYELIDERDISAFIKTIWNT